MDYTHLHNPQMLMSAKMETVIVRNKPCALTQWGHTTVSVFLDLLAMALTVKVRQKCKLNCSDLLAEVQHSGFTGIIQLYRRVQ